MARFERKPVPEKVGERRVFPEIRKLIKGAWFYLCECPCGHQSFVRGTCLRLLDPPQRCTKCGSGKRTHGMSKSAIYRQWHKKKNFAGVSEEWGTFKLFYSWIIKNGYLPFVEDKDMCMVRLALSKPWGPDNFILLNKSEAKQMVAQLPRPRARKKLAFQQEM